MLLLRRAVEAVFLLCAAWRCGRDVSVYVGSRLQARAKLAPQRGCRLFSVKRVFTLSITLIVFTLNKTFHGADRARK